MAVLTHGGARSRYRPEAWKRTDTFIAGASLGVLAVAAVLTAWMPMLLAYEPYPRATWPPFHWPICLAICLLGLPAFLPDHD
jgi:hypothetical protein